MVSSTVVEMVSTTCVTDVRLVSVTVITRVADGVDANMVLAVTPMQEQALA